VTIISPDQNQLDNFFMPDKRPKRKLGGFKNGFNKFFSKFAPTIDQLKHLPKVLSKKERYLLLTLGIIAIGSLIATPISSYYHNTDPIPAYGGSFTEGMVGSPKYINPLLAQTSDVDRDLSKLIYAGLMKFDKNGNFQYDLAKSYDISGDGLTYTFKLRDNLKWQDGTPLTADDVVFTIMTAQNSDFGSFQRINWQGVDASKADDQTVVFKLKNKYAQFLNNTTLGILPKHLWETVKSSSFGLSDLNVKAIGSGPYRFSKMKRDSSGNITSYEVTAFDNYYDGKPYISTIIFNFYGSEDKMIEAFNANQIDSLSFISAEKINQLRFLGKLQLLDLNMPRYFAIFFNQNQSKTLSDKNVRQALNYATNKQAILDKILGGKGTLVNSPVLPDIINIPDPSFVYTFDIEKAKKLLDDAGWKLSSTDNIRIKSTPIPKTTKTKSAATPTPTPTPEKLEINITTSNWPELVSVAEQIKSQWENIGVGVNIEVLALPELQQAIKDRSYESLLFGEVLGLDPDPFSFWHSTQKKDPGLNLALYDNKDVDAILELARQTLDQQSRFARYNDFQKAVISDSPVVFLYSPDYIYALPDKVKNVNTKIISIPSDRFGDINKWYIDTQRQLKK
jgi:peptide/nickel transport system substrate-binding protein